MIYRMKEMMSSHEITTTSWNPLIFAIYFGDKTVVKYILDAA